jgi:putative flippase GtrA
MTQTPSRLSTLYSEHGEKLRFLVVGGWNTVFSYGLFAAMLAVMGPSLRELAGSSSAMLSAIGSHWYLAVQWLSWIVAVPQSTVALKYLVFRSPGHLGREIGRAYFVYLPMQALSSLSLFVLVKYVGMNPLLGQLMTIVVSAVLSYLGHKYFTFKTPAEKLATGASESSERQ